MKTRMMLPSASLILLSLILLAGCGPGKYRPKPNEELYGTWTNESYGIMNSSTYLPQKEIIDPSGYTAYQAVFDHNPSQKGTEEIASKWTDSEGNIWYKTFGTASTGDKVLTFQALQKLNKFGTVRECVIIWLSAFNPNSYPAKIDPKDSAYQIYNRAGK